MKTDEEREALFGAFAKTADFFFVRACNMSFTEALRGFREIEADFISRAEYEAWEILEIKRRIAEKIFRVAHYQYQPIEVCREAWNDLVRLGFSNLPTATDMMWFYADCYLFNYEFAEGIAVLEPFLTDLKQQLDDPRTKWRGYLQDWYGSLIRKLHELETESRRCADPLVLELAKALHKLGTDLAEAEFRDYHLGLNQLEEEFLSRAGDDETRIYEIKWRTTYALFSALPDEVTFASVQACWEELLRLGFAGDPSRQGDAAWTFTQHCRAHRQREAAHAVMDPILAEMRARMEDPATPEKLARLYRVQCERLERVLDEREWRTRASYAPT